MHETGLQEPGAEDEIRQAVVDGMEEPLDLLGGVRLPIAVHGNDDVRLEQHCGLEAAVHGDAKPFPSAVNHVCAVFRRDYPGTISKIVGDDDDQVIITRILEATAYLGDYAENEILLISCGDDDAGPRHIVPASYGRSFNGKPPVTQVASSVDCGFP